LNRLLGDYIFFDFKPWMHSPELGIGCLLVFNVVTVISIIIIICRFRLVDFL